jgi:hypothetical protein
MNNKILWTFVGGIMLLAIAAWILVTGTDVTFRYLGAALFALLGGGILVGGLTLFKKEEEADQ